MRTKRWHWWYVALAIPVLALAVWAATPPPPQAHPRMQVMPSVQKLHDSMVQVTEKAAKKGDYVCCIAPSCEFCAMHMGSCPCGKMLADGKGVCRECKGGWEVGEGRMSGIKSENVKGMSTAAVMDMMKKGKK